jgi:UDP-N-acetylglucosamine 2-epimerase (non-hydrolysing)
VALNSKITVIFGTRPEAIKLAPVVKALNEFDDIHVTCISTQQHSSLLSETLGAVDLVVDVEMPVPDRSSLNTLTSSVALNLGKLAVESDLVVVQGDTLSAFAGALHGFLLEVPIAHVEAGLRTSTLHLPHPEEGLRRAISDFASLHLAPTLGARRNLEREGIDPATIVVTGNTSIDAIKSQLVRMNESEGPIERPRGDYCILTVHRRETWGQPMRNIANAVWSLARDFPDIAFMCPLHPNPAVRSVFSNLPPISNLHVVDPVPHDEFVALLAGSLAILTDSGGMQEEATVLGVPVVILRQETERPEVIDAGVGFLAGVEQSKVHEVAQGVINARRSGEYRGPLVSPFGDGHAGVRSAMAIAAFLRGQPLPSDMCPLENE